MLKKPKTTELAGTFQERLRQARMDVELSQSDLAKLIWGTVKDARGYDVAKNRDRISAYESGRAKPTRENLEAVATALGLDVDELAPDILSGEAFLEPTPAVELRMVEGGTFIKVNTKVPTDVAVRIVELLEEAGVN